jgi:hypothetical protein|nr:MAG TPA: hypothetical protein [Caudoviricetes sp.]
MSGKEKRREALLLGKKDMSFTEIMQAIEACRADDCDKCLLSGGPIAGWFPEDVPDCYTVLLKNAGEKLLEYYQKIRENDAAEENQRKQKKISKNEEARARESWTRAPFARYATMSSTNSA